MMKQSLGILALLSVALAAPASRSIGDGVFSAEQVVRGKKSYATSCADCHGDALEGDGKKSPALKGETFAKNWHGKTLHKLIDQTWRTMPPDDPRTLSKNLCADVAAYLLSENGYPAGQEDLKPDAPDLRQIVIAPPRK